MALWMLHCIGCGLELAEGDSREAREDEAFNLREDGCPDCGEDDFEAEREQF